MPLKFTEHDWCNAAVLPEKLGVDELYLTVLEDKTCDSGADALELVEAYKAKLGSVPEMVFAVKGMVPKLPPETVKAIKALQEKLPANREKLMGLQQLDENGEEGWRKALEAEIVKRNREVKIETKSCKGCGSKIATAHIRTFLCPVCLEFPFLQTETDAKAFAAKEERIRTLRNEVEGADAKIAELTAEGIKASEDFKRVWLVFRPEDVVGQAPASEASVEGSGMEDAAAPTEEAAAASTDEPLEESRTEGDAPAIDVETAEPEGE